jgi:hypothetical protein
VTNGPAKVISGQSENGKGGERWLAALGRRTVGL